MNYLCFLGCLWGLWPGHGLQAQSVPLRPQESAQYWGRRGSELLKAGAFAQAYSAFQLARTLGAPGMVRRMEAARRRNINHILLQSLMAKARGLAETDPVQGLRLLDYAHAHFPDSSRIVRQIGELINRPNLWLYSLKAAGLWPSPRMNHLVAATSPARLYACRGDSLAVTYTFSEPVQNAFFSPDDRFAWVVLATGVSVLLDCSQRPVRVLQLPQTVVPLPTDAVTFSANNRYVLLRSGTEPTGRLWQLKADLLHPTAIPHQNLGITPLFSPDGHYLFLNERSPEGLVGQLWSLTGSEPRLMRRFAGGQAITKAIFDPDSRWLLGAGLDENTLLLADLRTDSIPIIRAFSQCHSDRLPDAFSSDGRWLLVSFIQPSVDSLWALTGSGLRSHAVFQPQAGPSGESVRVLSRFSPDGDWLLRSSPNELPHAQCWHLTGSAPTLAHQFQHKSGVLNDVFSTDGRYLLSRHTDPIRDSVWQLFSTGFRPVFGFRTSLRAGSGADGPLSHFSADSRYLITYHAGAIPDSLWSLTNATLLPLYAFRERLAVEATRFSADGRWFLGGEGTSGRGNPVYVGGATGYAGSRLAGIVYGCPVLAGGQLPAGASHNH